MTTRQALALAKTDCTPEVWEEIEAALLAAKLCPSCACDGERVKLCDWEPATRDTYAGRECPRCEAFWPDKEQPCFYDRGDYSEAISDADPGL